jgi:purine nucleoside permease
MRILSRCPAFLLTMASLALLSSALAFGQAPANPAPARIPVKVVVVAMFEQGADTGDMPGELQYWVERDHLDQIFSLPAAYHDVRMNAVGELAIVTGQGTAHAAATVMALGLDPRFDLTHAYWLIAGIAGATPEHASLGSAVWANWIVDGDLGYEIDAREIPKDWPTGMLPLRKAKPYEEPAAPLAGQVYQTNRPLMLWAYGLTKDVPLGDSEHLKEIRSHFDGAEAALPPRVLLGDEVSSSTYWHGKVMDAWATRWMNYFTGGKGLFVTTAMEDTGSLQSLEFLAKAGKVDWQRVMVLRTVSNYDQQPRGMDAAASLSSQRIGQYGAYLPSLEAAYRVGHVVVAELISKWDTYQVQTPAK